jgi:diguanylate cyclase (GGDEF)-like protein
VPIATLDPGNTQDDWYFECIASGNNYVLSIGVDHVLQEKRMWLDYKVVKDGLLLGVISTCIDFSYVVGELFSQYDNDSMRGFIIDKKGVIYIDSFLLSDEDFLPYDYEAYIEDEFSDQVFLAVLRAHLDDTDEYSESAVEPVVVRLSSDYFNYATIAPIRHTSWSAIILYNSSSSFGMSLFVPISVIVLVLLIGFAASVNVISRRFIFKPFEHLLHSLAQLKENQEGVIYGTERNDEIGALSNTIHDLFTKANYDVLTGIYNRRFMENNLQRIMDFLSRSDGEMSVLMVDVDYFKRFNDTYGHEQGDICLKRIALALADSITRVDDFAARYGGEEFVIVLPNTNKAGACLITQKLIENVRRLNIPHASSEVAECVTVSVGVTTGKVTYLKGWEEYVKRADRAMYMSKQGGRNMFTYLDFGE